jgi:hypothetical protein
LKRHGEDRIFILGALLAERQAGSGPDTINSGSRPDNTWNGRTTTSVARSQNGLHWLSFRVGQAPKVAHSRATLVPAAIPVQLIEAICTPLVSME